MTTLDTILNQQIRQLDFDNLLAEIEAENRDEFPPATAAAVAIQPDHRQGEVIEAVGNGPESHNGLEPGQAIGHVDFDNFRGIYVGPGRRPGQALVKVMAGWTGEPPTWPVSIPYQKLLEV